MEISKSPTGSPVNKRACVRTNAASVFARAGQFEEAERLAAEAAALDQTFAPHLEAIRRMKAGKTAAGWISCGFAGGAAQ